MVGGRHYLLRAEDVELAWNSPRFARYPDAAVGKGSGMSRIAVIGAGISGMGAAYLLSQKHEVWLFEKETRLGGHTHTHQIETSRGVLPIDTGFIVHNDRTYPNLVRLFRELGVARQASDMRSEEHTSELQSRFD